METIVIETWIRGSLQACFDAARDLDLHQKSVPGSDEKAVAGRLSGLIEMGEEVTWRGRHFGVRQHFTSKITAFDAPAHFRDSMMRGAFKSYDHDHYFVPRDGGTVMRDVVVFSAPLGILGRIAERLFLRRYLERLLVQRAAILKESIERSAYR